MISLAILAAVGAGCLANAPVLLTYGDSKTRMVVGPSNNQALWQTDLLFRGHCKVSVNVGTPDGNGWIATNGITVAQRASTIDAEIAFLKTPPSLVLFNLGSNDALVGDADAGNEATWKANLASIWDAMHGAWPSARIYYSRTWRRDYDAESDRLAAWYADVAAGRSYVTLCDDERVWVKGTDDGATMFWDGIHFSVTGIREKARLAAACLGY